MKYNKRIFNGDEIVFKYDFYFQLLGGKGTRLEEITKGNIPKPLVEIKNNSLFELQLKHLISFGCKDFINGFVII